jgi:hypothetical protein
MLGCCSPQLLLDHPKHLDIYLSNPPGASKKLGEINTYLIFHGNIEKKPFFAQRFAPEKRLRNKRTVVAHPVSVYQHGSGSAELSQRESCVSHLMQFA